MVADRAARASSRSSLRSSRAASFIEEIRGNFGQAGIRSVEEAAAATVLHPDAVRFEPERNAGGVEVPRRRVG